MELRNQRGCRASRFPFAGRVALRIVGFLLVRAPGVLAEGKPYLLRDINEAGIGSSPSGFTAFGDRLFFWADDGTHGIELWVTDGTPEGTSLVEDLCPGSQGSRMCVQVGEMGCFSPGELSPHPDGTLFFTADDGVHGYELWALRVSCPDAASDAACTAVVVEVGPAPGGLQRPGDMNGDGKLDLSDAVWLLGHLFIGAPGQATLACEGGTASSPGQGDLALADVNDDGRIDLSDPVRTLGFLFLGLDPPALGTECVRIEGCQENALCQ